jgi:hypothetical protein
MGGGGAEVHHWRRVVDSPGSRRPLVAATPHNKPPAFTSRREVQVGRAQRCGLHALPHLEPGLLRTNCDGCRPMPRQSFPALLRCMRPSRDTACPCAAWVWCMQLEPPVARTTPAPHPHTHHTRPWLNLLLAFAPLAVLGYISDWSHGVVFGFALLAIAPFAERLGFVTEQLAHHTNETRECTCGIGGGGGMPGHGPLHPVGWLRLTTALHRSPPTVCTSWRLQLSRRYLCRCCCRWLPLSLAATVSVDDAAECSCPPCMALPGCV